MKVSIVRPRELGAPELARWREMLTGTPGYDSPFLAPDYAIVLGRVRHPMRVAVLEEDGEVAGFLPFELVGRAQAGPPGGTVSDAMGVVHRPGFSWDAGAFLRATGLRSWEFTNLLGDQVPETARYVVRSASPVIDFPDGYERYLSDRRHSSKQMVQSTMRKRRKLEREVGELRFELSSLSTSELRHLMGWKSRQYRATGEWDRFDDPRIVSLVQRLHTTTSEHCTGMLSVLYAGDRPAAAHFGIRSGRTLSWWFPAYEPELSRYSPGMQLLFLLVESGASLGLDRIDLGIGDHGYKDAAKTGELAVAWGLVDDGSSRALLRRLRRAPRYHLRPLVTRNPRLHDLARRVVRSR